MDADEFPVNVQRPLRDWRAREGDDVGIMLLEMWAYVLDVLAFYDERIANESYLPTAIRPVSLQELIALIGYLPRPAIGAEVTLALFAETGKDSSAYPSARVSVGRISRVKSRRFSRPPTRAHDRPGAERVDARADPPREL